LKAFCVNGIDGDATVKSVEMLGSSDQCTLRTYPEKTAKI